LPIEALTPTCSTASKFPSVLAACVSVTGKSSQRRDDYIVECPNQDPDAVEHMAQIQGRVQALTQSQVN